MTIPNFKIPLTDVLTSLQQLSEYLKTVPTLPTMNVDDRDMLANMLGVPNCILWAEADRITGVVDGTAQSSWAELSGSGAVISQSNATYKPVYHFTNGVPYLSNVTAGGFGIASLPSFDTGKSTVFLVARSGSNNGSIENIILNLGGYTNYAITEDSGQIQATCGSLQNFYSGHAASSAWKVFAFRGNEDNTDDLGPGLTSIANGNSTFRSQGTNNTSWTGGSATSGFIGGISAGSGNYWVGDYRAVVVFDRVLTDSEVFRVLNYLHRRFFITYNAPTEQLFFDGDSQMVCFTGADHGGKGVVDQVLAGRTQFRAYLPAIIGQTLVQAASDAATQIDQFISSAFANNVVLIWAGTNDLINGDSAATVYANKVAYCLKRRNAGSKVIVVSTLPRGASSAYETARTSLNTIEAANWPSFADGYVDLQTISIGAAGAQNNATLYQGDKIHPTPVGYALAVPVFEAAIAGLYTQPIPSYSDSPPVTPELIANKATDFSTVNHALYPSVLAVQNYGATLLAANDAMIYKGAIDCSANPNYPAADAGHTYRISVAGKIGGGSGINVEVGDIVLCNTDSTASGNQATVGTKWNIIQANIDGAYFAGGTDVAVTDGGTGSSTDSGARTNLGLGTAATPQFDSLGLGIAATPGFNLHVYASSGDCNFKMQTSSTGTTNTDGFNFGVEDSTKDVYINQRENANIFFYVNGSPALSFSPSQIVTMPHYGAGTATFDSSGNISSSSDVRLKNVIGEFKRGLDAIQNITPILYRWNAESGMETNTVYPGFSAQNVEIPIPEAVGSDIHGNLTIQDRGLIATLINAVKELSAKVSRQEIEIAKLQPSRMLNNDKELP